MSGYLKDEMILKVRLCVLYHRTRIILVQASRIGTSNESSSGYVLESGSAYSN
jgi:hypothetical protein